jgi:hypothetical protein
LELLCERPRANKFNHRSRMGKGHLIWPLVLGVFLKQLRFEFVPVFHGLQWRFAVQNRLVKVTQLL